LDLLTYALGACPFEARGTAAIEAAGAVSRWRQVNTRPADSIIEAVARVGCACISICIKQHKQNIEVLSLASASQHI
jgi:hypothetical protein